MCQKLLRLLTAQQLSLVTAHAYHNPCTEGSDTSCEVHAVLVQLPSNELACPSKSGRYTPFSCS